MSANEIKKSAGINCINILESAKPYLPLIKDLIDKGYSCFEKSIANKDKRENKRIDNLENARKEQNEYLRNQCFTKEEIMNPSLSLEDRELMCKRNASLENSINENNIKTDLAQNEVAEMNYEIIKVIVAVATPLIVSVATKDPTKLPATLVKTISA